jgi:hypothetical protein
MLSEKPLRGFCFVPAKEFWDCSDILADGGGERGAKLFSKSKLNFSASRASFCPQLSARLLCDGFIAGDDVDLRIGLRSLLSMLPVAFLTVFDKDSTSRFFLRSRSVALGDGEDGRELWEYPAI